MSSQRGLLSSGIELTYSIFPAEFNDDDDDEEEEDTGDSPDAAASADEEETTTVSAGSAEDAQSLDMSFLVSLAENGDAVTESLQDLEIAGVPVDTGSISKQVVEAVPETCVPLCKVCHCAPLHRAPLCAVVSTPTAFRRSSNTRDLQLGGPRLVHMIALVCCDVCLPGALQVVGYRQAKIATVLVLHAVIVATP